MSSLRLTNINKKFKRPPLLKFCFKKKIYIIFAIIFVTSAYQITPLSLVVHYFTAIKAKVTEVFRNAAISFCII